LTSRAFPENVASRALLKQLGFAEIGIHRRHGKLDIGNRSHGHLPVKGVIIGPPWHFQLIHPNGIQG
jgi:RimJ/RimL family protein N-acetyltransferase